MNGRRVAFAALVVAVAVLLPYFSRQARAQCSDQGCSCAVTTHPHNFGSYDTVTKKAIDTTSTIDVSCSGSSAGIRISYEIQLSAGQSGSFDRRELRSGAFRLYYNLYTKSSRQTIWGDGTGSSSVVTDSYRLKTPSGETHSYTAYGRIQPGQTVAPGIYTDQITVTVVF